VLICWKHDYIGAIVKHLQSIDPPPRRGWPEERFDVVWVFVGGPGSGYRFHQVPQLLLAGDLATPLG